MKQLMASARDTMAGEKRDDSHVYREIRVREIVGISQLRDPIQNLEEKSVRGRGRRLRRRKAMIQGSDTRAPELPSAKSFLAFQLYAAFEDLARE